MISDTAVSDEQVASALSESMGVTVQTTPSYAMTLDTEISTNDLEQFAVNILTALDSNVDTANMTIENDTVTGEYVVLYEGEKVVLTTDTNGTTTAEIFSDSATQTTSYLAVAEAVESVDTALTVTQPVVTEPNAVKTVVEHETAEIEVDVLDDFETTATTLAEELGYSDTTDYTMTTDPETGKVTLVISNASGEDITIEIAEKGDGGVIQISPSSDTNNNIVEAIQVIDSSYDSTNVTIIQEGTYWSVTNEYENQEQADNALNTLNDTTNPSDIGIEVAEHGTEVEETLVPEPEPTSNLYTTIKVGDTTSTPNDITDMLTENLGTTIQTQPSYSIELDSEIQASDKEAFIEEVMASLDSTYTLDTSDIVTTTDPNYPWITLTTLVISDTGEKIVLSTENNVTTVIVYSDTVTASGSEDAVSTAIQTTDTTIVMGTASVTEPNATVTEVTVETAQIEVPLIEDPEESARELAASLGLTDTTKYNIEIDTTTDTVTLVVVTTDTSEENVTIEIKESNGNSTISISPADVSYDTSYSVVEAVNEVTSGSYDSNELTTIPPGTYVTIDNNFEDESEANSAVNKLADTTNTDLEVVTSTVAETYYPPEPEPEPEPQPEHQPYHKTYD